jgi:hypothetical protein
MINFEREMESLFTSICFQISEIDNQRSKLLDMVKARRIPECFPQYLTIFDMRTIAADT